MNKSKPVIGVAFWLGLIFGFIFFLLFLKDEFKYSEHYLLGVFLISIIPAMLVGITFQVIFDIARLAHRGEFRLKHFFILTLILALAFAISIIGPSVPDTLMEYVGLGLISIIMLIIFKNKNSRMNS